MKKRMKSSSSSLLKILYQRHQHGHTMLKPLERDCAYLCFNGDIHGKKGSDNDDDDGAFGIAFLTTV